MTSRHMQCDNLCLTYGETDEYVARAIFKCLPALQTWALAATSSNPNIFPVSSVNTNMDYLF